MKSETTNALTTSPSEEAFTIPDLQALSQRAEASEEVNDNARMHFDAESDEHTQWN